jgi:hypothetical protein
MARCAVPVAGRSARRARARRGRSGDGKTSRRRGDESQIKKRSEPPHVGSYIRSVLPDGDGAARHPYHPKMGRRSTASLPPEKFVKDIIPKSEACLLLTGRESFHNLVDNEMQA